jgi:transposase-like protein
METMERKPLSPRRSFVPEFKAEVVVLVHHGKSVGAVGRELNLTETAVRAWVKRAEVDAGRPVAAGRSAAHQRRHHHLGLADRLLSTDRLTLNQLSKARPGRGKLTVTPTTGQMVDGPDQA